MRYIVKKYYSSFVMLEVEASSREEAYDKTKELVIDLIELQNNLEDWEEANEITEFQEKHWEKWNKL